jgi:beta-lactamase regulating signal transducer with metallopeptidase domain
MNLVLLNGLWQGALVVAIAALVTLRIPQRHAATRHAVWFTALLALALLPIVSLWHPAPILAPLPPPVEHTAAETSLVTAKAASASGSWLVPIWIAGVTFCLVRLVLSSARINRIVRNATPAPKFGIGVMISNDVAMPVAAGFFAPAIVIPADLATTLDPADLESIVQHERAHIRRGDIGANMVQRLIEAALFFNPWVYMIGRQLVRERESACDDWAVQAIGEPDRYASCLAQLAQGMQRSRPPLLTPSAIGSRRMLVGRIARLLNGKATQLKVNYFVLGVSVVAFGTLTALLQTSNGLPSIGNDVAVAASTCASRDVLHRGADVKILNAAMPNISKSAYRANVWANALVTVGPDGRPLTVKIVKSSGSASIDRATVNAAMASTYAPAMVNCKPTTGQYLFHVVTGP